VLFDLSTPRMIRLLFIIQISRARPNGSCILLCPLRRGTG
jgi:hypothetical protein